MPRDDLFSVIGRTALVTGSSAGIGRTLAAALAARGATVVLNGRDPDRLERARRELDRELDRELADHPDRGAVHAVAFDVTDSDAVEAAVAEITADVGPVDILVNNTGTQHRAPLTEVTDADWHRLLDTNLTGAFLVTRAVATGMVARGDGGKIVNICSLQSEVARPGIAAYAATKGALKMLTKGLCADLGPHGIQVNAIGPGYIQTELTAPLVDDPDFSAWVARRTPAARWGRTDDLVGALVFLASPASDFVNGQVLYVDGGMLAVL